MSKRKIISKGFQTIKEIDYKSIKNKINEIHWKEKPKTDKDFASLALTIIEIHKLNNASNSVKLKFLYSVADLIEDKEIQSGLDNIAVQLFLNRTSHALNEKGIMYMDKEYKYELALACYDRAINIEPNFYLAWHNRGLVLRKLNRLIESLASFDNALKIYKRDIDVWHEKGLLLDNDLKMYTDALVSFEQGLELNPTDYKCLKGKAFSYLGLSCPAKAKEYFLKARELHPEIKEVLTEETAGCVAMYSYDKDDNTVYYIKTK